MHDSGASRRENAEVHLDVIATMDCFAEPVIGRAFARPVGSSGLRRFAKIGVRNRERCHGTELFEKGMR
jgi:hypothetical protein